MKRIGCLLFIAIFMMISLAGCGSTAPKMEDFKVSVEEQIQEGKHTVLFWFENNSDFPITFLQVRYKVKEGITKEDIAAKFDYTYGLGEDYTIDRVFMDGIVGGENKSVEVKPKETSPKTELHRNNVMYVRDIAEFENMTPDVMTIKYLDKNNQEHTLYYNYKTKAYNEEGK